jgi:hypothetical protein
MFHRRSLARDSHTSAAWVMRRLYVWARITYRDGIAQVGESRGEVGSIVAQGCVESGICCSACRL